MRGKRKRPLRKWWGSVGMMDRILLIIAIFLLVFIVSMTTIFIICGAIPDTLVTGVFAVCGGECGVMGWIKNRKEQFQSRTWELEDRKRHETEGGPEDDEQGISG